VEKADEERTILKGLKRIAMWRCMEGKLEKKSRRLRIGKSSGSSAREPLDDERKTQMVFPGFRAAESYKGI